MVILTVCEPEYVNVTSFTELNLKSAFLGSTNIAQVIVSPCFAFAFLSPVIKVFAPTVEFALVICKDISNTFIGEGTIPISERSVSRKSNSQPDVPS